MATWHYRLTAQGAYLSMAGMEILGITDGSTMSAHRLGDADFVVIVQGEAEPTELSIKGRTSVCVPLTEAEALALRGQQCL